MNLSQKQFDQLHLFRCGGIGPVSYAKLVARYGSASEALLALPELSQQRKTIEIVSERQVKKEIYNLEKLGGTFVFLGDENYPVALSHIPDPPPVLSVIGNPEYLHAKQLAVVGNRNASATALKLTEKWCEELAEEGVVITSGLARGIDSAAHAGALNKGKPTIAVLAGGVDFVYPAENKGLYAHIQDYGCIVSEMPVGMAPTNQHFPRRNRIISGLSEATLVVEAPKKSGSLITARQAIDQGREVFAVPGSPMDARSEGPNYLIKQGAAMVESPQDILDNWPHNFMPRDCAPQTIQLQLDCAQSAKVEVNLDQEVKPVQHEPQHEEKASLISLISSTPVEVDELIRLSSLPHADVIMQLTELEILGEVERTASGSFVKVS